MGLKITSSAHLGALELKNRIILAPMGTVLGNLNPAAVQYFSERIRGGAAMIMCNIAASDSLEDVSHSIYLNDECAEYFRVICSLAHAEDCKVCAQLHPGNGRIGGPGLGLRVPICASAAPWMHVPKLKCHEMTVDEIHTLQADFRRSARRAVAAGADAIEIHAYGGYLTDQFLTARWNTRTDEYGGDLDGRMRFLRELIQITREVGGEDYPIIVKFSPEHYLPVSEGYRGMDEGLELARKLEACGVTALHVDAGCHDNWYNAMPPAYMQEATLQCRSAKAVREAVGIQVITNGRLGDAEKAEAALQNGVCDFVAIGRGLLADPFLPQKLLEGRAGDIRPCISCNEGCIGRAYSMQNLACAVNPFCGRESEGGVPHAEKPLRVLVIGAGPGGCTAALLAREAGHEVELWEKTTSVGGNAIAASAPYFKRDMEALPVYYREQLIKAGITVRFGREATHELVEAFRPDRVIWAAGGSPIAPEGIAGYGVYQATAALRNLVDVGNRVVVVGGGVIGVETALHFDRMGRQVTVIGRADRMLPKPMFSMNEQLLRKLMAESGVNFRCSTELVSVDGDRNGSRVRVKTPDGEDAIDCDTVLLALGYRPTVDAAESLSDICPVIPIGDAVKARRILHATGEAYEAVRKLGE